MRGMTGGRGILGGAVLLAVGCGVLIQALGAADAGAYLFLFLGIAFAFAYVAGTPQFVYLVPACTMIGFGLGLIIPVAFRLQDQASGIFLASLAIAYVVIYLLSPNRKIPLAVAAITGLVPIASDVLGLVGNTPLVHLSRIGKGLRPRLVAKLEMLNPGGSVKDRIGLAMIEDAEKRGLLKPGGTIVEPTSGNTGVGLAIAAALKGYRLVCTMPDKQSQEKRDILRAYGAEVVICPTAVAPEDPSSYYKVADRLAKELPGGFMPGQYWNQQNVAAHYKTTGPELWAQTDGKITHFVLGIGTGGTVTGAGRYLKEQNPAVQIVGADPEGSIYTGDVHPYN